MVELFANNAHGVLSASIGAGDTSLDLSAGEGAVFPNPQWTDFFRCSIEDGTTTEIVFVTSRSGDSFAAIIRGQEGTTPSVFSAGARVRLRPTAGMLADIAGRIVDEQFATIHGVAKSGLSTVSYIGFLTTNIGSGTHVHGAVSDTSMRTSYSRIEKVASTTADNGYSLGSNNVRATRGSGTNVGGFDQVWVFGLNADLVGQYGYWGLDNNNAASPTPGSPETKTGEGQLLVGFSSSSNPGENFFVYHSSGSSGTVTAVDTGIPRTTTGVFRLRLWCAPGASEVFVHFEDLETDASFTTTLTTNLPASTAFLNGGRHMVGGVIGAGADFFGTWRFNVNQSEPEI